MLRPASSPVARDHFWGILELIIRESGSKESDGKGSKKTIPARAGALRSFPSPPSRASRLPPALSYYWESQWRRQFLFWEDYFYQWNF